MSLILDALKKSERERQRDKTPGLQSIHQLPPRPTVRSRRQWWLVAGIIVLNGAVLAYWRIQQPAVPAVVPAATPAADAAAPVSPVPAQNPPTNSNTAATASNTTTSEFTRMAPTQMPAAQAQVENDLRIEEVGELPDDVRNNLPAMTFSFHVYSANAQQRTIIINNRRMREGDEVSAGVQLQQITEDGVILLHAGHRIHISVLSGW